MPRKINAVNKRNILARLQTIEENEREIQDQQTHYILSLTNTQAVLEELREEKNEMMKKLVKLV